MEKIILKSGDEEFCFSGIGAKLDYRLIDGKLVIYPSSIGTKGK